MYLRTLVFLYILDLSACNAAVHLKDALYIPFRRFGNVTRLKKSFKKEDDFIRGTEIKFVPTYRHIDFCIFCFEYPFIVLFHSSCCHDRNITILISFSYALLNIEYCNKQIKPT